MSALELHGPWRAGAPQPEFHNGVHAFSWVTIRDTREKDVCIVAVGSDESERRLAAILALPEMLDSLRLARAELWHSNARDRVVAAIALAEEGSE